VGSARASANGWRTASLAVIILADAEERASGIQGIHATEKGLLEAGVVSCVWTANVRGGWFHGAEVGVAGWEGFKEPRVVLGVSRWDVLLSIHLIHLTPQGEGVIVEPQAGKGIFKADFGGILQPLAQSLLLDHQLVEILKVVNPPLSVALDMSFPLSFAALNEVLVLIKLIQFLVLASLSAPHQSKSLGQADGILAVDLPRLKRLGVGAGLGKLGLVLAKGSAAVSTIPAVERSIGVGSAVDILGLGVGDVPLSAQPRLAKAVESNSRRCPFVYMRRAG
jgi:hypothetical protein